MVFRSTVWYWCIAVGEIWAVEAATAECRGDFQKLCSLTAVIKIADERNEQYQKRSPPFALLSLQMYI